MARRNPWLLGGLVLLLIAGGVAAIVWPQISANNEARRLEAEVEAAALARLPGVIAGNVDAILAAADASDLEIEAAIAAMTADPAMAGVLDTADVLRTRSLTAAQAAIDASLATVDAVNAAIDEAKDREAARLGELETLPAGNGAAFVSAAEAFIAGERADYHTLAGLQASRLNEWAGMIAFLQRGAGEYEFYEAEARARFPGASVDGEYVGYLSRLRGIAAEEARVRDRLAARRDEAADALTAAGNTGP